MAKFLLIILALIIATGTNLKATAKEKQSYTFYPLVYKNLLPDEDEFYVSGIFEIGGRPKALIARSKNKRATELFSNFVEYGEGDMIAENFRIFKINTFRKEILIINMETHDLYSLSYSSGRGISRMFKVGKAQK